MLEQPTVTIVIPAFNVELYISDALKSVFNQKVKFTEVIVIDDCSTDDTLNIINKYHDSIDILLSLKNNIGLGAVRNLGLHLATSEYIYFMDSDDTIDDSMNLYISDIIMNHSRPDVVAFGAQAIKSNGDKVIFEKYDTEQCVTCLDNIDINKSPSACLYVSKASLWSRYRISFPHIYYEDELAFVSLIINAENIYIGNKILYNRRVNEESITNSSFNRKHKIDMEKLITLFVNLLYQHPNKRQFIYNRLYKVWSKYIKRTISSNQKVNHELYLLILFMNPIIVLKLIAINFKARLNNDKQNS